VWERRVPVSFVRIPPRNEPRRTEATFLGVDRWVRRARRVRESDALRAESKGTGNISPASGTRSASGGEVEREAESSELGEAAVGENGNLGEVS